MKNNVGFKYEGQIASGRERIRENRRKKNRYY